MSLLATLVLLLPAAAPETGDGLNFDSSVANCGDAKPRGGLNPWVGHW